MDILVTGSCGFIGSRLVPKLIADGHKITAVDTQWFGDGDLPKDNGNLKIIKGDVRDGYPSGHDAVIWLASISNNDMYGVNYHLTNEVNTYLEIEPNAKFIYASSVAVLDPTSHYAKDKLHCEAQLKDTGAIIVRAASVCGYSANMRFDITINRMTHDAYKKGVITVNGGEQERGHIHLDDLCDFYKLVLAKGKEGATYTACAVSEKIKETARKVAEIANAKIEVRERTDNRDYSVWGDSMDWVPKRAVWDASRDIIARFEQGCWKDTSNELLWRINRNLY